MSEEKESPPPKDAPKEGGQASPEVTIKREAAPDRGQGAKFNIEIRKGAEGIVVEPGDPDVNPFEQPPEGRNPPPSESSPEKSPPDTGEPPSGGGDSDDS